MVFSSAQAWLPAGASREQAWAVLTGCSSRHSWVTLGLHRHPPPLWRDHLFHPGTPIPKQARLHTKPPAQPRVLGKDQHPGDTKDRDERTSPEEG